MTITELPEANDLAYAQSAPASGANLDRSHHCCNPQNGAAAVDPTSISGHSPDGNQPSIASDGTQLSRSIRAANAHITPNRGHTSVTAHDASDNQKVYVGDGTQPSAARVATNTHSLIAAEPNFSSTNATPQAQTVNVEENHFSVADQTLRGRAVGEPTSPVANDPAQAQSHSAAGEPILDDGQDYRDLQANSVVVDPNPAEGQPAIEAQTGYALGGFLRDPVLGVLADVVDDLEKVRIANENRVRILTRTESDSDGEERGFGLTNDHPEVAKLALTVKALAAAEHDAVLNLQRALRKHPLGPWVKRTPGVGEKQAARLLAVIGDPYFNDLRERPRTVGELWAYCGYHVINASGSGQQDGDDQIRTAAAGTQPHPDVAVGVAPKRTANWSEDARKRAWLIATSCIKVANSPYRKVYDDARLKYSESTHPAECVRCGPKGKPAHPGSPLSPGHQHARAMRLMSKAILRDLWIESRALHEAQKPLGSETG